MSSKFKIGDRVRKIRGSRWVGVVVGTYSTTLTPEGYCVASETEVGSVQIYPASALEAAGNQDCEVGDVCRIAFESWVVDNAVEWRGATQHRVGFAAIQRSIYGGGYIAVETDNAWLAWQEAWRIANIIRDMVPA